MKQLRQLFLIVIAIVLSVVMPIAVNAAPKVIVVSTKDPQQAAESLKKLLQQTTPVNSQTTSLKLTPQTASSTQSAPPLANSNAQNKKNTDSSLSGIDRYAGRTNNDRTLSLSFANIRTRELLQILAQFANLNFVISDTVEGSMSIHLKDVTWRQALNVILKSQGLGMRRTNNIVLVAPLKNLAALEIQAIQIKQQLENLEPPINRVLTLKYAKAEDIAKLITENGKLLSTNGSVSVDKRTNSIWLYDTPSRLRPLIDLVHTLDHPTKQIMIEARLVLVDKDFTRELGAKFGISQNNAHLTGTLNGANQIATGTAPSAVAIADRLAFNMPVSTDPANSGHIAVALAKVGRFLIDTELQAIETQGHSETLSSPRLITSNQHPAYIKEGEEIPYEESTSSGATSVAFKSAELELRVTPQIIPPNRIMLDLKISNNSKGTSAITGTGGSENFPIDTQEEESQVLLDDNQTVILGGVYKHTKSNSITRVPFLGRIPILGLLFSKKTKVKNTDELLIFLTPHIINKPSEI